VYPVFEFDQGGFDAEQGINSFPLAQFYEIKISPNLNILLHEDGFEGGSGSAGFH